MRNFENSQAYKKLCYQAVQHVPYPVRAIWGANDPGLTYDRYGKEIKEIAQLAQIYQLPAKHLLQEDQWQAIADYIVKETIEDS